MWSQELIWQNIKNVVKAVLWIILFRWPIRE